MVRSASTARIDAQDATGVLVRPISTGISTAEKPVRLLIIEDDEEDYLTTTSCLREVKGTNFQVRWCDCLKSGLTHLAKNSIDVILIDLALPDSDGLVALEVLREVAPDMPVLVLTSNIDDAVALEAVRHGAQDLLVKGRGDADGLVRSIRYAIERKRSEIELRQYQEQLQEMVDEATRELLNANAELEREVRERKVAIDRLQAHDEARSLFVSNVSHELKTPLASISHAVENLLLGVGGALNEKTQSYLEMIQQDSRRLRTTVEEILDVSRIEQGKLRLNRMPVHIGRFVKRAVDSLDVEIRHKLENVMVTVCDSHLFVKLDPRKIERAIINIVGNAIKYTQEGGSIEISVFQRDSAPGYVFIEVIDDGIGIPEEHLLHVTERYYRVGEHVEGTGIGLSLSKEVVELHGGSLALASPPPDRSAGTAVTFRLPTTPAPQVMVVDDDAVVRSLLEHQLDHFGYAYAGYARGLDVLGALERGPPPSALLVDLGLPDIDGANVIAHVKSDVRLSALPVLAITGRDIDGSIREFLEGFGIPALAKPWEKDALLELIEDLIIGTDYLVRSTHEGGKNG